MADLPETDMPSGPGYENVWAIEDIFKKTAGPAWPTAPKPTCHRCPATKVYGQERKSRRALALDVVSFF